MIDDPLNRLKVKRGMDLPQSKLNEQLVKRIREEYAMGQEEIARLRARYSRKALAKEYGVHIKTIEKVLTYETWSHVQ